MVLRDQMVACVEVEEFNPKPWLQWTGNAPQGVPNPRSLSFAHLAQLCDDPARDLPGGVDVRAVLTLEPEEGFFLSARDGDTVEIFTSKAPTAAPSRPSATFWRGGLSALLRSESHGRNHPRPSTSPHRWPRARAARDRSAAAASAYIRRAASLRSSARWDLMAGSGASRSSARARSLCMQA